MSRLSRAIVGAVAAVLLQQVFSTRPALKDAAERQHALCPSPCPAQSPAPIAEAAPLGPNSDVLQAATFEGQVAELLAQLEPTPTCRKIVQDLAGSLQRQVDALLPGAEVQAFLSGPFRRSTPYAASVPEIEVVVLATVQQLQPVLLKQGSQEKTRGSGLVVSEEDTKKSLRYLAKNMLKSTDEFRWRRSSYALREASVTLVAPRLGDETQLVAFELSLNGSQPSRNACLMAASSAVHGNIKGLLQMVRRWAKVRGICKEGQGYFSPYVWTLLVVYFLQVSVGLLPALSCSQDETGQPVATFLTGIPASPPGVPQLFSAFARFYSEAVKWSQEELCVLRGSRPTLDLSKKDPPWRPCPKDLGERPRIRDPFLPAGEASLAALSTVAGVKRVRQELVLAVELTEKNAAPLNKLLEQWVPENLEELEDGEAS